MNYLLYLTEFRQNSAKLPNLDSFLPYFLLFTENERDLPEAMRNSSRRGSKRRLRQSTLPIRAQFVKSTPPDHQKWPWSHPEHF